MKLHFTEFPVFHQNETYILEIEKMADLLLKTGVVHSVFQVGGVSNPGISDVDLLVVFKNDVSYLKNPVLNLPSPANYLFTHRLFGSSKHYSQQLEQYTFFNNYKLIAGESIEMSNHILDSTSIEILKKQIALEYLIKAYISIYIGIEFKLIKVRSFLLHAKAIMFDFDFLGITDQKMRKVISDIIELRANWFNSRINENELSSLVMEYSSTLLKAITESLQKFNFYLPIEDSHKISRSIYIHQSDQFTIKKKGISLPGLLIAESPLLSKVNNRLNKFNVSIPFENNSIPKIVQKRYDFLFKSFEYNRKHLPGFICTGHGLNIFDKN